MPVPYPNQAPIQEPTFVRIADKAAAAASKYCRPLAEQGFDLIIDKQSGHLLKSPRPIAFASGVILLTTRAGGPQYLARAFCKRGQDGILTAYAYFTSKHSKSNKQSGIAKITQEDISTKKIGYMLYPLSPNSPRSSTLGEYLLNAKGGKSEPEIPLQLPGLSGKDPKLFEILKSATLTSPQKNREIDLSQFAPQFDSILKHFNN